MALACDPTPTFIINPTGNKNNEDGTLFDEFLATNSSDCGIFLPFATKKGPTRKLGKKFQHIITVI